METNVTQDMYVNVHSHKKENNTSVPQMVVHIYNRIIFSNEKGQTHTKHFV